jgi:hypothetical protein
MGQGYPVSGPGERRAGKQAPGSHTEEARRLIEEYADDLQETPSSHELRLPPLSFITCGAPPGCVLQRAALWRLRPTPATLPRGGVGYLIVWFVEPIIYLG